MQQPEGKQRVSLIDDDEGKSANMQCMVQFHYALFVFIYKIPLPTSGDSSICIYTCEERTVGWLSSLLLGNGGAMTGLLVVALPLPGLSSSNSSASAEAAAASAMDACLAILGSLQDSMMCTLVK